MVEVMEPGEESLADRGLAPGHFVEPSNAGVESPAIHVEAGVNMGAVGSRHSSRRGSGQSQVSIGQMSENLGDSTRPLDIVSEAEGPPPKEQQGLKQTSSMPDLQGLRGRRKGGLEKRFNKFLERQLDGKWDQRRKLALLQREIRHECNLDQDVMLQGSQGVKGFKKMLKERFGTITAAWRVGLDSEGNGKVSFGELRRLCSNLGLHVKFKPLWAEMDRDGTGFISLEELDPEAARGLAEFSLFVQDFYGTTLDAWRYGFNPKNEPRVSEEKFIQRCNDLAFEGDPKKIFEWLRTDMAKKEITFHDFDPPAAAAQCRADPCAESIGAGTLRRLVECPTPKAPLSPLAASRQLRLASMSSTGSMCGSPTSDSGLFGYTSGGESPAASVAGGSINYGASLGSAVWGRFPPAQQRGRPSSLSDSAIGGRSPASGIASPGSGAWSPAYSTMSKMSGHASPTRNSSWIREVSRAQIAEIHAKRAAHEDADVGVRTLAELKSKLVTRFGSVLAGWQLALDPFATGTISFTEFAERLRHIGYLGDLKSLWSELDADVRGVLTLADLDPQADALLSAFRTAVSGKHQTMLNAWLSAFDPHGRGVVEKDAFVKQCMDCGFEVGPGIAPADTQAAAVVAKLFRMLQDKSDGGRKEKRYLTLREFDSRAYRAHKRQDMQMVTESTDKIPPLEGTFYERQERMRGYRWKQAQSASLIAEQNQLIQEEMRQDKCCTSLEGLMTLLVRKYGNCATAWRCVLDPGGQGHLSRDELVQACRNRAGYRGDLGALWSELVRNRQEASESMEVPAFVTLHDLDPVAAETLWSFRQLLLSKYDSLIIAWQQGLDPRKSNRLEEEDFCKRCKVLGFEGDAHALFAYLRAGPHSTYITLHDVDLRAAHAYYRGDDMATTMHGTKLGSHHSPKFWAGRSSTMSFTQSDGCSPKSGDGSSNVEAARDTRITEWSRELGKRKRHQVVQRSKEDTAKTKSIKGLADFRASLTSRFRSTVAAWRSVIDPAHLNRLTHSQLLISLERIGGFNGKVKLLWEELDPECRGFCTLQDLDPRAAQEITNFRFAWKTVSEDFATVPGIWDNALNIDGFDKVNEELFLELCTGCLGDPAWTPGRLKAMYKLLMPDPLSGRNYIVKEDVIDVLLLPVPMHERKVLLHGEEVDLPSPGGSNLQGSTRNASSVPISPEMPQIGKEDFLKLLRQNFGGVFAGWLRHLDIGEKGRVPRGEFVRRARAIGANCNVGLLFEQIDTAGKGYIALEDLDPEVDAAINALHEMARDRCGSLAALWLKLDPGARGYLSMEEFARGCEALGYPGDAKRLAVFLRPEKDRHVLHVEDLGHQGVREMRAIRSQHSSFQFGRARSPSPASSPKAKSPKRARSKPQQPAAKSLDRTATK